MEQVSLDVLRLPMTSSGNNTALVAVDYLSRLLWFEPMQREDAITLSETFARMFKNTGFPMTVITDQGMNMLYGSLAKQWDLEPGSFGEPFCPSKGRMI